eukprot:1576501-Pleurochrysis_carterae.AAC.1
MLHRKQDCAPGLIRLGRLGSACDGLNERRAVTGGSSATLDGCLLGLRDESFALVGLLPDPGGDFGLGESGKRGDFGLRDESFATLGLFSHPRGGFGLGESERRGDTCLLGDGCKAGTTSGTIKRNHQGPCSTRACILLRARMAARLNSTDDLCPLGLGTHARKPRQSRRCDAMDETKRSLSRHRRCEGPAHAHARSICKVAHAQLPSPPISPLVHGGRMLAPGDCSPCGQHDSSADHEYAVQSRPSYL